MSAPYYDLPRVAATRVSLRGQPAPILTDTPPLPSPVIPASSLGKGGSGRGYGSGRCRTRRGSVLTAMLAAGSVVMLTAGCGSDPGVEARDPVTGRLPAQAVNQA